MGETRLTLPLGGRSTLTCKTCWPVTAHGATSPASAPLYLEASVRCGLTRKTRIGNQLRRSDADNRAIGGTLNLNSLWSKLGTFSISYNDDRRYNSHYYTADYYQSVYSGTFGSLGLRAVFSAITTATAAPIQGNISLSISRYHWATGLAQG